jgi:TRAP-type C4-dicarboxylate transport system permease small subunit
MTRFERILELVERIIEWFGIVVIVAMLVISIAEIIGRDLLNAPIAGSLDLTLLIMIWMVLLVSGIGVLSDLHIRVAFFVDTLPETARRIIELIVFVAIFLFGLLMSIQSIPLIQLPGIMPQLNLSNGWLFAPLLLSGIEIMLAGLGRILRISLSFRKSQNQ